MQFNGLSKEGEHLLEEILKVKQTPTEKPDYWNQRFAKLSFDEDTRLRSVFKEVQDKEFISVLWADDIPYFIEVLNKGYAYFENKKEYLKNQKKLNRREWKIAITSAIMGGVVGLLPYLLTII